MKALIPAATATATASTVTRTTIEFEFALKCHAVNLPIHNGNNSVLVLFHAFILFKL